MLQLVYISSANGDVRTGAILTQSRANNARDGITGLLYADTSRFLQALEGPEAAVEKAFARIRTDERHRAIVVLSRRAIDKREFGPWSMAQQVPGEEGEVFVKRVERLIEGTSANVRATFDGLVRLRRAA